MGRSRKLTGAGLLLHAQMTGGIVTIAEHLDTFCLCIREAGLKPWEPKGRKILDEAVEELRSTRAYETLTRCDKCGETYSMSLSKETVDIFVAYSRDLADWGELARCVNCGGPGAGDNVSKNGE